MEIGSGADAVETALDGAGLEHNAQRFVGFGWVL